MLTRNAVNDRQARANDSHLDGIVQAPPHRVLRQDWRKLTVDGHIGAKRGTTGGKRELSLRHIC